MEEDLIAWLLAGAGVTALVGEEINASAPPRGSRADRIVIHRIAGAQGYTYAGRDGLEPALFQIDCWSSTFLAAKTIARAVAARLAALPSGQLAAAFIESERDSFETGDGAPDASTPSDFFRSSLDVRVWRTAA